jgi:hypothetical protein
MNWSTIAGWPRRHFGATVLLVINCAFLLYLLSSPGRPYVIPFQDQFFGFYPSILGLRNFLSAWTPNDFGRSDAITWGNAVATLIQFAFPNAFVAETILVFIGFGLSGAASYVFCRDAIGIKSQLMAVCCALVYEFNWFTFEFFASNLVIFAYASFPLILLFSSRAVTSERMCKKFPIGLAGAFFVGAFLWGIIILPVLISIALLPILRLAISNGIQRKMAKLSQGFETVIVGSFLYLLITISYALPTLTTFLQSGGSVASFAQTSSLVASIPTASDFTVLFPRTVSILFSPLSPTFRLPFWYVGIVFPLLLGLGLITNKRLIPFAAALALPCIALIAMTYLLIGNSPFITTLYEVFFPIRILDSVTAYLLIIVPLILFLAYIGLAGIEGLLEGKRARIKLTVLLVLGLLFLAPIMSHNAGILKMNTYGSGGTLDADNYNHPILLVPQSLENLVISMNEEKASNPFRVLWIPLDQNYKQILGISIDDSFSTSITKDTNLTSAYTTMLNLISTGNVSSAVPLMTRLGFEYVVVLKDAMTSPPGVLMTSEGVPVGITGNASTFLEIFDASSAFSLVSNETEFAVFQNRLDATSSTVGVFSVLSSMNTSQGDLSVVSGPPSYLNDEFTLRVDSPTPSTLIFSTQYSPGWTASVTMPNGTTVEASHGIAMGWANSFRIPKGENMTILISYSYQLTHDALIGTSILAAVACAFLYITDARVPILSCNRGQKAEALQVRHGRTRVLPRTRLNERNQI